jgi:hypothetical protein
LVKTPRIPVELISAKVILVALGEARDSSAAYEKMLTAGCHTFANATAKPSAGRCVADFLYQTAIIVIAAPRKSPRAACVSQNGKQSQQ